MLVLTRKSQEQIRIGDDIVVTILRVKGNSIRVGIEAPRDVRVVRGELPPKESTAAVSDVAAALSCLRVAEAELAGEQNEANETASTADGDNPTRRRTLKDYLAAASISNAI